MVGTACFRLRFRGTSHCMTTIFLSKSHYSSPHPYFIQVIGKPCVASPIDCQSRSRSCQARINVELYDGLQQQTSAKPLSSHCNTCTEKELDLELQCATIWHGLLPSRSMFVLTQSSSHTRNFTAHHHESGSLPRSFCSSSKSSVWPDGALSSLRASSSSTTASEGSRGFPRSLNLPSGCSSKRDAMASCLLDGSWNVAWDARPARWLHGCNSAWLLFGVRSCDSMIAETIANPGILPSSCSCLDGKPNGEHSLPVSAENGSALEDGPVPSPFIQREASVGYTIIGMPSDGRCLFRAIAHGALLRRGMPFVREELQEEFEADDLRNKVVDELASRRMETEWFIEDDFDTYVQRMREPYIWGGEPELLMATHVLKMPITVHLLDKLTGELISVAEYGKEYGIEDPIRVLYHGFGHYDALQIEKKSNPLIDRRL